MQELPAQTVEPICAGQDRFSLVAGPLVRHELTKLAPGLDPREALGYCHAATIERPAVDSASAYARYVSAIRGD